jgi:carboxynorspermidine decarboxylase
MPYFPDVRGAEHIDQCSTTNDQWLYRLGGNSCLSGDFMGLWRFDHELQVGEQVIFEDMIHYTTVKTTTFNGITHPAIAMLRSDSTLDVLRRFTYEDYRNRMD